MITLDFTDDNLIHIALELAKGNMNDKQLLDMILAHLK
jgi:hypothetical protein